MLFLCKRTLETDGETVDADIFRLDKARRIGGIVCGEEKAGSRVINVLEGGLSINDHSGDLAIVYIVLLTNEHIITVHDGGHHAVTGADQGEVCLAFAYILNVFIMVFYGFNGIPTGDCSEDGDSCEWKRFFSFLPPNKIRRTYAKSRSECYNTGLC